MKTSRSVGRPRATKTEKREVILAAASYLFATQGYDKTTIRLVAQKAGVDPKLVMHYFDNKQKLFVSCMEVPIEARTAVALIGSLPKSKWGKAIAELVWDIQMQENHPLISLIRAAATEPEAAELLTQFHLNTLIKGFVAAVDIDNKELRLVMVSSLISGFTFSNRILRIYDGIKATDSKKKALFASAVQSILTAKL
jgi:AcrR family transcriptional regulator